MSRQKHGHAARRWVLPSGAPEPHALLDKQFQRLKAQYAENAADKRFTSPEKVDDLWMTQVQADLTSLHGLYAWKLVGGRKDMKPGWIHNEQGVIHRSGMKYMDEVDGRKGVLLAVPLKPGEIHRAVNLGHPPHVTIRNAGKCRFLRVGVKGYHFPFVLKVLAGGRELFSQEISEKDWSDLKVDVKETAETSGEVTLELLVPPEQGAHEAAWFDYIDFFEN